MIKTARHLFHLDAAHPSWHDCIKKGLALMNQAYLDHLYYTHEWLPGPKKIFNAFSIPMEKVTTVLLGESPYPRAESANGYAFWDANVKELWSDTGLSKPVNRATSLRNMIKMLLICENSLKPEATSQQNIASINKSSLIKTNDELFHNLLNHGFLLLNASLVLQKTAVKKDAKEWQPFIKSMLEALIITRPNVRFLLLGNIAKDMDNIITSHTIKKHYAEHPYNLSFITNPDMIAFFKPMHLLRKN